MIAFDVSWVGVIVAAIAQMVIGFAWYSNSLFGKQWRAEMKMSDAEANAKWKDGMSKTMIMGLVTAALMAFVLSNLARTVTAGTMSSGAVLGFWMWLGFILPLQAGDVLWGRASQKLLMINSGYWLITLAVMGAIVSLI